MLESVRGIVESCGPDAVVLRLGGISIKVAVPGATINAMHAGEPAQLFTHLYLREDVLALYGFSSVEERSLFEELLSVTGVGPRSALGFLTQFSPTALRQAIADEDLTKLIRVPGIGRKTAQRVILELKGKLSRVGGTTSAPLGPATEDLMRVLTESLGYSAAEAAEALRSGEVATASTDEDKLRAAIRYFTHP